MSIGALVTRRSRALGPIGLDVGAGRVKAAQLRRAGGAWTLHAFASIPRAVEGAPLDAGEANRINDVLFRRGFAGNEIVLAVPDSKLLTVNLELPPRSEQIPLDQIARAEFARSVKTESDPFEFAYWDLPSPARAARATHVMGVGCRHVDAEPLIDAFELAGFEVVAMDVQATALTRACSSLMAAPQDITALVDIGRDALRLFVMHQGVATYRRSLIGHGMRALRAAVAEQIGVRADDDEVIDYVFDRVTLGDDARIDSAAASKGAASNAATANTGAADAGAADSSDAANAAAPALPVAAVAQARRVIVGHFDAVLAELTTSLSYTSHQYPDAPFRRVLLSGGGAAIGGLESHLASKLQAEVRAVQCADIVSGAERIAAPNGVGQLDRAAASAGVLAIGLALFDRDARRVRRSEVRS